MIEDTVALLACTGSDGCGAATIATLDQDTTTCPRCRRTLTVTPDDAITTGPKPEVVEAMTRYNRERSSGGAAT